MCGLGGLGLRFVSGVRLCRVSIPTTTPSRPTHKSAAHHPSINRRGQSRADFFSPARSLFLFSAFSLFLASHFAF